MNNTLGGDPVARTWRQTFFAPSRALTREPVLWAILALAAALRCWNLGHLALWNDEAFSWAITRDGIGATMAAIGADFHPPAYYLLLGAWQMLFGDTVVGMRGLSVVAGLLSIALTAWAADRLFGRPVALVAALLLAVHPTHLLWSQTMRGYAVLYCFSALALAGATYLAQAGRGSHAWRRGSVLFVIGAVGACYTHNVGLLLCGTLGAALLLRHWQLHRLTRLRHWLLPMAAVLLCYLPWAARLVEQAGRIARDTPTGSGPASVYAGADASVIVDGFVEGLLAGHLWGLRPLMVAVALVLAAAGAWAARRRTDRGWLALCLVLPPVGCALGYLLIRPVFAYMFFTSRWYHLLLVLLLATGLAYLLRRARWVGVGALAASLALSALSAYNVTHAPRVRWDQAVDAGLARDAAPGSLFAAHTISYWAPLYYASRSGAVVRLLPAAADAAALPERLTVFAVDAGDPALRAWEQATGVVREQAQCSRDACALHYRRKPA